MPEIPDERLRPRSQVIDRAWRVLGPGLEPLSGPDGAPLTRTVKLVVLPLVLRPVLRPELAGDLLTPRAAGLAAGLLRGEGDRLVATARWFALLKRVRRALKVVGGNPQDLYFQRCYELAAEHGAPDGPVAEDVARAAVLDAADRGGRTVSALREHLGDPERARAVAAALARAWADRPLPVPDHLSGPAAPAVPVPPRDAAVPGAPLDTAAPFSAPVSAAPPDVTALGTTPVPGATSVPSTSREAAVPDAAPVPARPSVAGASSRAAVPDAAPVSAAPPDSTVPGSTRDAAVPAATPGPTGPARPAAPAEHLRELADAVLDSCLSGGGGPAFAALVDGAAGRSLGAALWTGPVSGWGRPGVPVHLGLTAADVPPPPAVGAGASTTALPAPLDRSVYERVFTLLRTPGHDDLPPVPELVDAEVARACAPLGLTGESLRAALLVGGRLAAGLDPLGSGAGPTAAHRALDRRWRRESSVARARRATVDPAWTQGPFADPARALREPWTAYVRRLWARLHGRDAHAVPVSDTAELWALLDGISYSVLRDHRARVRAVLRSLAAPGPETADASGSAA
ncbi:hypothetical protein [Nocardiopsis flavescens]